MNRRDMLKRFVLGSAATVIAGEQVSATPALPTVSDLQTAPAAPPLIPIHYANEAVAWPCGYCHAEHATPLLVWPSVKLSLSCPSCGRRQSYLWHLKKFDPNPTEYGDRPAHAMSRLADTGPRFANFEPTIAGLPLAPVAVWPEELSEPNRAVASMTPRERAMEFFRERRARKMARRTARG